MKRKIIFCWLLMIILTIKAESQVTKVKSKSDVINSIEALKDTLMKLSENSGNAFFKMHCSSMVSVINSKSRFTSRDSAFLENTYRAFNNQNDPANAKELLTYLNRQRPFIFSWISPTDGAVSFSWLNPPKNWNPENEYPLYIQLHGLWSVASNSIEYLTYPFLESASNDSSFEDGYLLSPWGRGNLWYQGISETDIRECIGALEDIVLVDPARKYLSGHSMGGYGAWSIGSKSPGTWAALGIHAGALWYDNADLVNESVADALKDVPTYFVCGTNDDLLEINQTAYHLLEDAGNPNLQFVTFVGAHVYIEENVENMYLWMRNFVNEDWTTVSKKKGEKVQPEFRIKCYPNPVTATLEIVYSVPENSTVNISIYDIYGRFIFEVADAVKVFGEMRTTFDTEGIAPGIYIIRMKSGEVATETKIIVVK
jgi:Secretion system C-terminal sorting domain/Putative esterase